MILLKEEKLTKELNLFFIKKGLTLIEAEIVSLNYFNFQRCKASIELGQIMEK